MQATAPLLLCILFLSLTLSVTGQVCQLYQVTGESKCDAFLANSYVLLSHGLSQQQVQAALYPTTLGLGAFVPQICRSLALQFTCAATFFNCVNGSLSNVIGPCQSLCEFFTLACNETFYALGLQSKLPPCGGLPNNNCLNLTSFTAPAYKQVDCPYPLRINKDLNQATLTPPTIIPGQKLCLYPCPDPEFSSSEYDGAWVVSYVLGFISLFTGLFMITTWILAPMYRRFPENTVIWLLCCATGVAAATVWPVFWGGVDNVVCTTGNPPQPVRMDGAANHDAGCIIQGIVLFYCALASNFWWLAVCIYLFVEVVLSNHVKLKWFKWFMYGYHVLAWGYPLVALIIALGAEQIAASATSSYCFVGDYQGNQEDYNGYVMGLYVGPSFVCIILGCLLTVIAFTYFALHKFRFNKGTRLNYFQAYQLLSLIMFGSWLFNWINIEAIYGAVKIPEIKNAIMNQVQCSALTGTNCALDDQANYGILWINLYNAASAACVMFICVGLSLDTFRFWWRLLKAVFTCQWEKVWEIMTVAPDRDEKKLEDDDDGEEGNKMTPPPAERVGSMEESSSSSD